jgi:hypothetical protein
MKFMQRTVLSAALICLPFAACAQGKPAHKDALLYFVWPQNGTTIKGGFWCRFGLRNMGVTQIRMNRFRRTNHTFILVRARPKRASSFHPASIRFSSCSAMPNTSRTILQWSRRKSLSRSDRASPPT